MGEIDFGQFMLDAMWFRMNCQQVLAKGMAFIQERSADVFMTGELLYILQSLSMLQRQLHCGDFQRTGRQQLIVKPGVSQRAFRNAADGANRHVFILIPVPVVTRQSKMTP
jgi:hypothetical protein